MYGQTLMIDYASFDDRRIKHMEIIQAVIGRLGNDSFLVKGWAITIAGAFFGFAVNSTNWQLALAGLLPTLSFWGLDGYFLRSERLFRALHEHVRKGSGDVEPFFMGATTDHFVEVVSKDPNLNVSSWWRTCWSRTLAVFYGAICISALGVIVVISSG